ncbi:MAG: sulfatase-like hydrolase/transferase, partial [candidate division Zixibacteria bacterium]|nr:sulfatase-like hydrolase/transferase [candidate division Zixibacteria bacterium]
EIGVFVLAGRIRSRRYLIVAAWIVLPALFVVSQTIHAVAYETNDIRVTGLTPQLPFYAPITSHRRAVQYTDRLAIGEDKFQPRADGNYGTLNYPLSPIICDGATDESRPNIVILFLESWRHDMMNDSVTPNINALAQKATVCRNHLCSGNSTVAGIFGFFYGLYPTYWPAVKAANAVIHNSVLMDVLADENYTFGIYAKSNFERHKIKDAVFRDIPVHENFAGATKVVQDADMNDKLLSFLRERKKAGGSFAAFAFYKANHAPYAYPIADTVFRPAADQNLMEADDDTDPTEYLNDYRNSTRYVDRLVGNVLRELDSLGFMANTIVIVTTDHAEEFNDNRTGCWGHGSNYTRFQTHVPLVFYAPGKAPRQIESATSHIDIVPTLLDEFFGCHNPVGDYSNGRNLFKGSGEKRPLVVGSYVNHAIIIDDNVYEINPYHVKEYKLDDIRENALPPSPDMLIEIAEESGRFFGHQQ